MRGAALLVTGRGGTTFGQARTATANPALPGPHRIQECIEFWKTVHSIVALHNFEVLNIKQKYGPQARLRSAVHHWKHDLMTFAMSFFVSSNDSVSSTTSTFSVVCNFCISSSIIFGSSRSSHYSSDTSRLLFSASFTFFYCCNLFTFTNLTPFS